MDKIEKIRGVVNFHDTTQMTHDISSDEEFLSPYIIPIQYKTGYPAYESALLDVLFFEGFIKALTVRQCRAPGFSIPPALPNGTVKFIGWSETEATSNHFLLVEAAVPSLKDVRVFLGDQQSRLIGGYRCIIISVRGEIPNVS